MRLRKVAAAIAALTFASFWGLAASAQTPSRDAPARAHHIDRVRNQTLTGDVIARFRNISYEECEERCLANPRCNALDHFHAVGRIEGRKLCRLYGRTGEPRISQFADVGWKRPGPRPGAHPSVAAEEARRANEARKAANDAEQRASAKKSKKAAPSHEPRIAEAPAPQPPTSLPPPVGSPGPVPPSATPPLPEFKPPVRNGGGSPRAYRRDAPSEGAPPPAATAPAPPPPPPAASTIPPPPPPVAAAPPRLPPAPPIATAPPPAPPLPPAATAPAPRTRSLTTPSGGGAPPPAAAPANRDTTAPAPAPAAPGNSAATTPSDWDVVPVFYGTDRIRKDEPKRIVYTSDRARRMELGRALVTVPKVHQVPAIERPWAIKIPYIDVTLYQEAEDPKRHFTVQEIKALSKDEALALIRARLAGSKTYKNHALVFVHGYNNSFDDALYRTAQLAYDLKFDGAPFLYSWPSGGGTLSYPYDRDSAQQAEQYLSKFLQMVVSETGADSVDIIAHSMGNQPLLQVLRDFKRSTPEAAKINQVILAAPDVDRDTFEYLSSQITGISRGVTLYASANDKALVVSRRFAGGVPRAGDVPADLGPTVIAGIDTIDVSALSTEYLALNHSSYAEKSALIQDIEQLLLTGLRPPERRIPILLKVKNEKGEYWRYPN